MDVRVSLDLKDLALAIRSAAAGETLDRTVMMITEAARRKWTKLAQERLHSTRGVYLRGLSPAYMSGPQQASIELVGKLANMIEQGASAYDMRPGLLSGPGVKIAKDGHRYRAVPFRFQSPGSNGLVGTPMDDVYSYPDEASRSGRNGLPFAGAIGEEIYTLAKQLKRGQSLPNTGLPRLQNAHALDPFTGMRRGGSKGHRYYVAFRTISEANPQAWQHPGFNAANLAVEVAQYVARIAPKALGALGRDLIQPGSPNTPVHEE